MRAYRFLKLEHGLNSLRDKRLKISLLDELNDPFEFLAIHLAEPLCQRAMQNVKNMLASKYGILCFSSHWKSPLLWAHYAENHKGICLGFDISEKVQPRNVTYIEKRYNLNCYEIIEESNIEEMRKLLSTKHKHWKYEDEIRLFTELTHKEDRYYYHFSEDVILKEVIIGYKARTTKEEIIQEYGSDNINISKVTPSYTDFTMVKDTTF